MTNPTRWHVIKPPRLVYAAPILVYGELFTAMIGIALARGNFLGAFVALAITHPIAIWITHKEPHADTVVREYLRRFFAALGFPPIPGYPPAATRNTWKTKGHSYVP